MPQMNVPNLSEMSRREIEDYLVERSYVDLEFRRRFLNEPEKLLIELGLPVGPNVKISVLEEQPNTFYVVIPRLIMDSNELSDDEAQMLSGGTASNPQNLFFKGYK